MLQAKNHKLNSGFTLIELLVVIAIIGILSSVVLASLNTARTRGNDAAIRSEMSSLRTQAELERSTSSGYNNAVCNSNDDDLLTTGTIGQLRDSLLSNSPGTNIRCGDSATAYAVTVQLNQDTDDDGNTDFWCVDNSGFAGALDSDDGIPSDGDTSCQ